MQIDFSDIIKDRRSRILLECLGPEIYAVGGAIRDKILKREIADIDYSVKLHPTQVKDKLESKGYRVIPTGLSHQTVTAVLHESLKQVEITSFRNAKMNSSGGVYLGSSIEEDLSYRDFTCNALAVNISTGTLIDHNESLKDISAKIIRAIPEAQNRFKEDPLRILRMVRLAAQLGFSIDKTTFNAAHENFDLLSNTAKERIRDEFSKTLTSNNVRFGLEQLRELGFFKSFIPELQTCVGFEQNKYHSKDVYYHTLDVVERSSPILLNRLSALFHDIGKPPSLSISEDGERHFYLHEKIGAKSLPIILKRLMYPKNLSKAVELLTYTHMRPLDSGPGGLRRIIRDTEPYYAEWRELKESDTRAVLGDSIVVSLEFAEFDKRINTIKESPSGSIFKNLAINGLDIKSLGIKEGPIYKEILKYCQELVIDSPEKNIKSELIEAIKSKFLA